MDDRRDYVWKSVAPADLVLLAGRIAYRAFAIGAHGPMALTGRDDANRASIDAWLTTPVHIAVAGLLALGGPSGMRQTIRWRRRRTALRVDDVDRLRGRGDTGT
jgi:hypothetical protein